MLSDMGKQIPVSVLLLWLGSSEKGEPSPRDPPLWNLLMDDEAGRSFVALPFSPFFFATKKCQEKKHTHTHTTKNTFWWFFRRQMFFQSMATLRISRDLKTGGLEIEERCCIESISPIGRHLITDNCVLHVNNTLKWSLLGGSWLLATSVQVWVRNPV